jgi:hypothetical protein
MAKYYRIDSTVPAYANRFGLTGRDKYVYANSPSEARRTALALIGPNLPAAALLVEEVPVITGSTAIEKGTGELLNYQPTGQQVTSVDPTGYIPSEFEEGLGESGISLGLNPGNIEGYSRGGGATGNLPGAQNLPGFTGSDVPGFNLPYRGSGFTNFTNELEGGPQNLLYPANAAPPRRVTLPYDATSGPPTKELLPYDPLGGGSSDYSIGYDPYTYGETYTPPSPKAVIPAYDPLGAAGETLGFDPEARGIDIDELDRQEAERAAQEVRDKLAKERRENQAKQDALLTGPVRSWDAKLADITISYDSDGNVSSVNLPVDMWRNAYSGKDAERDGRGGTGRQTDQTIGKEQIEDAIRRLAELGGRDNLGRSVRNMLQQGRNYYANTPRGNNTWDKNIEGGLIPEADRKRAGQKSFLNDSAWEATWGDIAGGVLEPKKAGIESQIPDAWANNPAGFNSYSKEQQETIVKEGLKSHQEVENHYAAKAMEYDPSGGGETGMESFGEPPPPATAPPGDAASAVPGADDDYYYGETFAGDPKQFDFAGGAMEGWQDPAPAPAPAAGTVGVPAFSSQDLINDPQGFLTAAGQRLAFRNVFGEPATGVGPLASYLQRQTYPLSDAYRAASFANMGREQAGGVAPQTTFENFLTSVRDQPTGLGGAYGQALQNVDYLRGLGGSQVPTALAGVFNPEQAANTRDARALLEAAQRGKYSGLVSRSFRRPTEDDLFSDYVLARQDASTAGTAPQNFLNFAASRYGL